MSSSFKTEYLGVWPTKLSTSFEFRCRNCKRLPFAHEGDNCLFESTLWEPMTKAELELWSAERNAAGVEDEYYVPINPKE